MTNVGYAAAAALAVAVGGGSAVVGTMQSGIEEMTVPDLPYAPSNLLDGRSFYIEAEVVGWDEIETDELLFRRSVHFPRLPGGLRFRLDRLRGLGGRGHDPFHRHHQLLRSAP